MRTHWEECWRFETARFAVVFEVTPCQDDPADSFEDDESVQDIREGRVDWFDCRVRVLCDDREIGADYLSCCAYTNVREFYESHRDKDPLNRNCSIMRAAEGENVCICHYFPSMVAQAIDQARGTLADVPKLRVAV